MRLEAQTGYYVRMNSYKPTDWRVTPRDWQSHPTEHIFLCPHIDLLPFIRNSYFWPRVACKSCETSAWVASCENEALYVIVQGLRNMGKPLWYKDLDPVWHRVAREKPHNITGAMIMYNAKAFGTRPEFWGLSILHGTGVDCWSHRYPAILNTSMVPIAENITSVTMSCCLSLFSMER